MDPEPHVYAADRAAWRAWLAAHHAEARLVWLIFYKKGSGRPTVDYEAAVEEALCFGWIDSVVHAVDATRYAQKFTPRRPASRWSESNVRRVRALVAGGRMTPAGLAAVPPAILDPAAESPPAPAPAAPPGDPDAVPAFIRAGLEAHPPAWAHFAALAPSHRRAYVRWITAAKREETQARRLAEAIGLLVENRKLPLK